MLIDDARGEHGASMRACDIPQRNPRALGTDEVYSDLDPDRINALPDSAFHRNVDLEVPPRALPPPGR